MFKYYIRDVLKNLVKKNVLLSKFLRNKVLSYEFTFWLNSPILIRFILKDMLVYATTSFNKMLYCATKFIFTNMPWDKWTKKWSTIPSWFHTSTHNIQNQICNLKQYENTWKNEKILGIQIWPWQSTTPMILFMLTSSQFLSYKNLSR